jgi:hypothetical protein
VVHTPSKHLNDLWGALKVLVLWCWGVVAGKMALFGVTATARPSVAVLQCCWGRCSEALPEAGEGYTKALRERELLVPRAKFSLNLSLILGPISSNSHQAFIINQDTSRVADLICKVTHEWNLW